ncbi:MULTISPECIES: multicopper oxidase family protein [Streptomyces]|uniref:multicopper oxidase family protein n=1 Tax=Streptomyces TaxID=1883 RepID=UPI00068E92D1|nr:MULTISPECIES: multicopper oxidase family protein [unclassified Streptomyces]QHF98336.1 multicopper oxidase family protein [Streptomyces sp. NHF165]
MRTQHTPSATPSAAAAAPARRAVLGAGAAAALAGAGLLAGCSDDSGSAKNGRDYVAPDGPEVRAAEKERGGGRTEKVRLTAAPSRIELGDGTTVRTWAYGERLPGKEVRVTAGSTLALTLANHLPQSTSLHWHGLALRNDMDGVPALTQRALRPGAEFTYRFAVPHPGTYWFHPHSGVQQDRGLYAPLIVEDPKEPLEYDKEWVVVLDDWVDGVEGSTPDAVLAELRKGMGGMDHGGGHEGGGGKGGADHGGGHGGMDHGGGHDMGSMSMSRAAGVSGTAYAAPASSTASMASAASMASVSSLTSTARRAGKGDGPSRMMMGATSELLGGDAGDVKYPYHLVNGRTEKDPEVFRARPGDRVRIRFVNAGGDTAYRVALGGHRMTVTHTDGFPVEHARTDALLLGMGERYDVLVTVEDGVFPLTALAEGKKASARALLRTGGGAAPKAGERPAELDGKLLTAQQLDAAEDVSLKPGRPDRTVTLKLTGSMAKYDWGIDGEAYDPEQRRPVAEGERVRLRFVNTTDMWHPMHLHGHTFQLPGGGPRKDTAIVLPGRTLEVDFDADNPGLWMLHCHNVYHGESGMMTVLGYLK